MYNRAFGMGIRCPSAIALEALLTTLEIFMKHSLISLAALLSTVALATGAQANNATVEDAIKSRPDLSVFYDGLVSTGIFNELKEGQPYTVFAPTNDAFAKITREQYPCFYTTECKAQVAAILRKHIVPGEKHLADINPQSGGVLSLFSVDNQHISAAEPTKEKFTVDGAKVLSENQLLGGEIYRIDEVLASERDLAQFVAPSVVVVHAPGTDLPPATPPGKIVTVTTTTAATHPIPY